TDTAFRIEFFGDEVDRISEINALTGEVKNVVTHVAIYPASHYIVPKEKMAAALDKIRLECDERVKFFQQNNK
ncbi:MAG: excinuclease ABC subunit B, partial [Oscillospiraceae bacterium]